MSLFVCVPYFHFRCPCVNSYRYCLAMCGSSALFLLCVGFCSSSNYWRVVHTRQNLTNFKLRVNYCLKSLPSLFEPFLPAAVLIVVFLVKGEYFVCAMAGEQSSDCAKKTSGQVEVDMSWNDNFMYLYK